MATINNTSFKFPMGNSNDFDLADLIFRKIRQEVLSEQETVFLQRWVDADQQNKDTYNDLLDGKMRSRTFLELQQSVQHVKQRIDAVLVHEYVADNRIGWRRISYWAAAMLIAAAATFWWLSPSSTPASQAPVAIEPGSTKAQLTLSDGSIVTLNEKDSGMLTRQGQADVLQQKGQLVYQQHTNTSKNVYNIVATPRGGQYKLQLADGSNVWLNAATRLRFPSGFSGNTRTVELLEGEAYFEVAQNVQQPFIVKVRSTDITDEMQITVLGTSFNIQAYPSQGGQIATLLAGKVMVRKGAEEVTLQPLQQVKATVGSDNLAVASGIVADTIIDWTRGLFIFRDESLRSLMHKISVWYDIDVEYIESAGSKGGQHRKTGANGKISRSTDLKDMLRILERAGVQYQMEGRKIKVYL